MKVILAAALSADGFIGPAPGMRSFEWTSKEDRSLIVALSKEMGVIVMGSGTYNTFKIKRVPPGRRLIVYTKDPSTIEGEGVETTTEDPRDLVNRLEQEGAHGLIVEGGSSIYTLFMQSGVVDEIYITIEPVLFGQGIPFFNSELNTHLALLESSKINDDTVLLHYVVKK